MRAVENGGDRRGIKISRARANADGNACYTNPRRNRDIRWSEVGDASVDRLRLADAQMTAVDSGRAGVGVGTVESPYAIGTCRAAHDHVRCAAGPVAKSR